MLEKLAKLQKICQYSLSLSFSSRFSIKMRNSRKSSHPEQLCLWPTGRLFLWDRISFELECKYVVTKASQGWLSVRKNAFFSFSVVCACVYRIKVLQGQEMCLSYPCICVVYGIWVCMCQFDVYKPWFVLISYPQRRLIREQLKWGQMIIRSPCCPFTF